MKSQQNPTCQRGHEIVPDRIADELSAAVEAFNDPLASPEDRVALIAEIRRLRALIGKGES